ARRRKLAPFVNRWDGVACCQGNNVIAPAVEERIGAGEQRCGPQLGHCRECRIEFPLAARVQDMDFLSDGASSLLNVSRLGVTVRTSWVHEHGDQRGVRNYLAQQPQPLWLQ